MKLSEIPSIYRDAVTKEARDEGFHHVDDFLDCQAGMARLKQMFDNGHLDGMGGHSHYLNLARLLYKQSVEYVIEFSDEGISYKLYEDGSMYIETGGWHEVWACAEDWLGLLGDADALCDVTANLVRYLGREIV